MIEKADAGRNVSPRTAFEIEHDSYAGFTRFTVDFSVTLCPLLDGLGETVRSVVVAWITVCFRTAEVLAVFAVSPPYSAVIEWPPTASVLMDRRSSSQVVKDRIRTVLKNG